MLSLENSEIELLSNLKMQLNIKIQFKFASNEFIIFIIHVTCKFFGRILIYFKKFENLVPKLKVKQLKDSWLENINLRYYY